MFNLRLRAKPPQGSAPVALFEDEVPGASLPPARADISPRSTATLVQPEPGIAAALVQKAPGSPGLVPSVARPTLVGDEPAQAGPAVVLPNPLNVAPVALAPAFRASSLPSQVLQDAERPAPADPLARLHAKVPAQPEGGVADSFALQLEEMVNCLMHSGQVIERGLHENPRWLLSFKAIRGDEAGCRKFKLCSTIRVVANEARPEESKWRALAYPITRVTGTALKQAIELEGDLVPPWASNDKSAFGGNGPGLEGLLDAVDAMEVARRTVRG